MKFWNFEIYNEKSDDEINNESKFLIFIIIL